MIYAYLRVSTTEQADSGLGIAAQHSAIDREAESRGWRSVQYHEDAGASGASLERPGLTELLDVIDKGDVLVVSKLDRLSRSVMDFASLLERAKDEGWSLVALDFGMDTTTPQGELVANILMSVAQWERRVIGQRTKDGLAEAKRNGKRLGRPSRLPEITRGMIQARHRARSTPQHIANYLNEQGIPTVSGGRWSRTQVSRVIRTL